MMRRKVVVLIGLVGLAACRPAVSPDVVRELQQSPRYTCCNIHHETDVFSDANYYVGAMIPLGSSTQVQSASRSGVVASVAGTPLTFGHTYGAGQESFQQYMDKLLVTDDPKAKLTHYSKSAQDAVRDGRVERGMTREQVILSLGYPPTHRTPSLSATEWTYWYNTWVTYRVAFDDAGVVREVIGRPAPTRDEPVHADAPPPKPAKKSTKKHK